MGPGMLLNLMLLGKRSMRVSHIGLLPCWTVVHLMRMPAVRTPVSHHVQPSTPPCACQQCAP